MHTNTRIHTLSHTQVQARLQQFSGEQLAAVAAALARLRYRALPEWLADYERASQSKLGAVSAGGLANAGEGGGDERTGVLVLSAGHAVYAVHAEGSLGLGWS